MSTPTILHVLESYGAGSARAAEGYAAALPEFRHVVLRHLREGESVEGQDEAAFAAVHDLPASPIDAIRTIRQVVRTVRPHRIHAHSSFAGAWVRLALPARVGRRAVVYTPHCFAFERRDLAPVARMAIRSAERLLANRTATIAACSVREADLARSFRTRRPVVVVPNVAQDSGGRAGVSMDLLGIGRLGVQKDPELFARIASAAVQHGVVPHARWAGDGPARAMLERFGVDVLGWRPPDDVRAICATGGVYLHTARWEGFPLAILEAHRAGLPILARRIPAMAGMPSDWLFDDVGGAMDLLRSITQPEVRAANRAAWTEALDDNTVGAQRDALLKAYDLQWKAGE